MNSSENTSNSLSNKTCIVLIWSRRVQEKWKTSRRKTNCMYRILLFLQRRNLLTSPWAVSSTCSQALTHCLAAPGARLQSGFIAALKPTAMFRLRQGPFTLIFRVMRCLSWRSKREIYCLCVAADETVVQFFFCVQSSYSIRFSTPCSPTIRVRRKAVLFFFTWLSSPALFNRAVPEHPVPALKQSTTAPQSTFACKVQSQWVHQGALLTPHTCFICMHTPIMVSLQLIYPADLRTGFKVKWGKIWTLVESGIVGDFPFPDPWSRVLEWIKWDLKYE